MQHITRKHNGLLTKIGFALRLIGCFGVLLTPLAHAQNGFVRIPSLPQTPYNYANPAFPAYFALQPPGAPPNSSVLANDNTPTTNAITNAGATLGRVLFYEQRLSQNSTIACASCHKQQHGFSDPALKSLGFLGGTTRRHGMGLTNARFYRPGRAFWDERAASIEDQALLPIQDTTEMGLTLTVMITRIQNQSYYAPLFTAAFGDPSVSSQRVQRAIAQFVRSLVSYSSKYDTGRAQVQNQTTNFPNFTTSENRGKQLFFAPPNQGGAGCAGCHTTEAFINPPGGPQNNGLDATSTIDFGAFEPTGNVNLTGAFKTPSLRNIAERAPYMHDGRFSTLEQVVEHYNSGVQNHPFLAPPLRTPQGQPLRLNLSATDKQALVDFLKTLSDPTFMSDPKFSDPFISVPASGIARTGWEDYQ